MLPSLAATDSHLSLPSLLQRNEHDNFRLSLCLAPLPKAFGSL